MSTQGKCIRLLMAEDDTEDQMLVKEAFQASHLVNRLDIVENGDELMDYLYHRGAHQDAKMPDIILLDLNMPRKDGREALVEIKANPELKHIPVIVLTTSSADEDIVASYDLGVNSYIQKPVTFEKLVDVVTALGNYWFKIVKLPPHVDGN